jgi:rhodanese-related sulfurtransferase
MTNPGTIVSVDVTEAERRLREDPARPVLLDVREMNEFVEVRAPGAMLLPTSVLTSRLDDLPTDRPLLVICHVGGRSAAVTGYLARAGRTDVINVAGGMDAWAKAGLPIRRGPLEPGEGEAPVD